MAIAQVGVSDYQESGTTTKTMNNPSTGVGQWIIVKAISLDNGLGSNHATATGFTEIAAEDYNNIVGGASFGVTILGRYTTGSGDPGSTFNVTWPLGGWTQVEVIALSGATSDSPTLGTWAGDEEWDPSEAVDANSVTTPVTNCGVLAAIALRDGTCAAGSGWTDLGTAYFLKEFASAAATGAQTPATMVTDSDPARQINILLAFRPSSAAATSLVIPRRRQPNQRGLITR